jgi:glutamate/tyrosine decarboxylase-like PLP-dependent enzyme
MHTPDAEMARLASKALLYSIDRIRIDPPPLGAPRPYEELLEAVGQTITKEGITGAEALRLFTEVLAPSSISVDHPKFLSFVPGAPTEASIIFDMVVSAASIYAGSWLEGAGAVFAENQALRWIADLGVARGSSLVAFTQQRSS